MFICSSKNNNFCSGLKIKGHISFFSTIILFNIKSLSSFILFKIKYSSSLIESYILLIFFSSFKIGFLEEGFNVFLLLSTLFILLFSLFNCNNKEFFLSYLQELNLKLLLLNLTSLLKLLQDLFILLSLLFSFILSSFFL